MGRTKITKITVEIDGKSPISIDVTKTDAIFFTDKGIEVLANHYDKIGKATVALGVKTAWTKADTNGELPVLLRKLPDCTFA